MRVEPADNSIVVFPAARLHSVVPVSCPSKELANSRFVINGHVNQRVAARATTDVPMVEALAPMRPRRAAQ